jgi:hypothetical protein
MRINTRINTYTCIHVMRIGAYWYPRTRVWYKYVHVYTCKTHRMHTGTHELNAYTWIRVIRVWCIPVPTNSMREGSLATMEWNVAAMSLSNAALCGLTASCIHTHTHTYIHLHTCTRAHIRAHVHTCIHTSIYIYIHLSTFTRTHTYTHAHTYIHTLIYTYIHLST